MGVVFDTLSKLDRMNQWVYRKVSPYIGNRILEAGCGNGNITSLLLNKELVVALDNDEAMIEETKRRYRGKSNIIVKKLDLSHVPLSELKSFGFDTILCINALEHILDDFRVLNNFNAVLRDDGYFVLIVPAFKELFCSLDRAAGHYRRYTKRELTAKILASGFDDLTLCYANFFGIFGWIVNGIVFRKKRLSTRMLALFDYFVPFFEWFEKKSGPPVGLSLIAVCRKHNKK